MFADPDHVAFEATWNVYQNIIDAYQTKQPAKEKTIMTRMIDLLKTGVPAGLTKLHTLGKTLQHHRDDILAFFDHPGTSNGPTEAINGLLEHLRGTARDFRSIINYITKCLLNADGFRPHLHPNCEEPHNRPARKLDAGHTYPPHPQRKPCLMPAIPCPDFTSKDHTTYDFV